MKIIQSWDKGLEKDKLDEFCNLFDLKVPLSRPFFFKIITIETGLNDFHKMILTCNKSHYSQKETQIVHYRYYENFNETIY